MHVKSRFYLPLAWLLFEQLKFPSPRMPSGSEEEGLYKSSMHQWLLKTFLRTTGSISLYRYYSLIEKIVTLHLRKLESLSLKEALCQVWFIDCFMIYAVSALYLPSNSGKLGRYWTSGSGEDFKKSIHFHYAAIISHWKKLWSFILVKL